MIPNTSILSYNHMAAQTMQDQDDNESHHHHHLISSLPVHDGWSPVRIRYYQGFWYPEIHLPGLLAFRHRFIPRPTDVFLCSPPKSGTTWLKSLTFAILFRHAHPPSSPHHPLLSLHPHDVVPLIDELYWKGQDPNLHPNPRIFSTHAAYQLLPQTLKTSDCKLVYICREPKDTVISGWHYIKAMTPKSMEPINLTNAFEMHCNGVSSFGPMWEHQLGYWKESFKRPSKILFLKYEEVMREPLENVRRLAEFLGLGFSEEEEEEGMVEEIVRLCSFETMKEAEGNRKGDRGYKGMEITNASFFRKGKVGDWENYLSGEMAKRLDGIFEEKLWGSGLSF